MRLLLIAALILSTTVIAGCAAPARVDQMQANIGLQQVDTNSPLRNELSIGQITGGKSTNPMWVSQVSNADFRMALEKSLAAAGLLSNQRTGKYELEAHLDGLRQPLAGASITVSAKINYRLIDKISNAAVFEKTVDLPYTASFSSAFIGTERLRIANEGAIKKNIEAIIRELLNLHNVSKDSAAEKS